MRPSEQAMHDVAKTLLDLRRQNGAPVDAKVIHQIVSMARAAVEIACDCDVEVGACVSLEDALDVAYGQG